MSTTQPRLEEVVYSDLTWAESPRSRDGIFWISDTQGSRLIEVRPGETLVHELEAAVNGTSFLPNGDLVAAGMASQRVDRFHEGTWELHADLAPLQAGRMGDMTTLSDGTIYVDALGAQNHDGPVDASGRILKIDPDGNSSVAAEGLVWPNGLALIDDSTTLVVAETFVKRLTAFTVGPDGSLSDPRLWLDLEAELGAEYMPDGLWPTRDGSVWAAATTGGAAVKTRQDEVVQKLDVDGFAIACCLDADERNLYVTVANSNDPAETVLAAVARKQVHARVERYSLPA
jgi:sugar lactone lactonase YvrE